MRYEALIAVALVMSQAAASSSVAQGRDGTATPQFTAAETRTVGRNELLQTLMDTNPWLVRRILDVVAEHDAASGSDLDGPVLLSSAFDTGGRLPAAATARSDAASVEWLGLLRQIRDQKEHKAAGHNTHAGNRTAAGSIELLDALKKARKEKGDRK
jgi:hypothetical protein